MAPASAVQPKMSIPATGSATPSGVKGVTATVESPTPIQSHGKVARSQVAKPSQAATSSHVSTDMRPQDLPVSQGATSSSKKALPTSDTGTKGDSCARTSQVAESQLKSPAMGTGNVKVEPMAPIETLLHHPEPRLRLSGFSQSHRPKGPAPNGCW